MSRLCPIKPLLRQLGDNAYRASPALISGESRELPYIALGAAHSLLQCVSPDVALPRRNKLAARLPLSAEHRSCSGHHRNADLTLSGPQRAQKDYISMTTCDVVPNSSFFFDRNGVDP